MKYKSCKYLENGIAFFSNSIEVCCTSSNIGGGSIKLIENYNGEQINWEELELKTSNLRKEAQKNVLPKECKNCAYLIEKEWEQTNIFKEILIGHWTYCNCNCIYCYTEKNKKEFNTKKTYSIYPIIKEMIEKKLITKETTISFGGGEPTILTEFEDLMELLLNTEIQNIRIHSDGIKYSKSIEKGLKENKITLITSVDSGTKETYKKIKQQDTFEDVWSNLKKYANTKKEAIKTKYVIIPVINDNISEINKWLEKSKEIGIKNITVDIEDNWYKAHITKIPTYVYQLLDYILNSYEKYGMKSCELYERALNMQQERKSI